MDTIDLLEREISEGVRCGDSERSIAVRILDLMYGTPCEQIRHQQELEEKTQWRPIETAPKDGSPVLATDSNMLEYPKYTHVVFHGDGCWYFFDDATRAYNYTHWMPLPPPPGTGNEYRQIVDDSGHTIEYVADDGLAKAYVVADGSWRVAYYPYADRDRNLTEDEALRMLAVRHKQAKSLVFSYETPPETE